MNTEFRRTLINIIIGILIAFTSMQVVEMYMSYRDAVTLDQCSKVSRRSLGILKLSRLVADW